MRELGVNKANHPIQNPSYKSRTPTKRDNIIPSYLSTTSGVT
jgi:hypothetical protein